MITIEGGFGASVDLSSLPVDEDESMPRIRRFRRELERETRLRGDGAIVREDSGEIVPPDLIREKARVEVPESHAEAYERHNRSTAEQHASQELSAEQRYEMRSAFGKSKTVINAVSGETYQT